ncbi:MAG: hypothetical protein KGJ57_05550 [Sphingomonadales bacterium]|nr:hypothetical protein [Sphingomonadales bacterium]MDE2168882.1 hypothetical protein [Sphingomonadales bacterium]
MSNPAAILSAGTSLSALLGGGAAAGGVTSATGEKGNNSSDFSSFLATPADQSGAATPSATTLAASPVSAGPAPATPVVAADTQDNAPAPTGKNLPLAALASAVLPLPVTLTALTTSGDSSSTSTATTAQADGTDAKPATSVQPDVSAIAQNAALAMILQTPVNNSAALPRSLVPTTEASADTKPAPVSVMPGFTLLDNASDGVNANGAAARNPSAVPTASADGPPVITLQAQAAIAMANPSVLASVSAHPGFSLTIDTPPGSESGAAIATTSAALPTANPDPAIPTTSNGSQASSQPSTVTLAAGQTMSTSLDDTSAMPSFASIETTARATHGVQTTPTSVSPVQVATAPTVPAAAGDDTDTPGFATIQLAAVDTGKGLSPRLAVPREPITTDAKSADRVSTANAGDNDQPGFTLFHSPTAPAANGASAADNAPDHDPLLASAGAATQQPLQAVDGAPSNPTALMGAALATAAPQTSVQPMLAANTGTSPANDMSALVDRLVEARAAARSGLGAQTTLASISHTDFGRVSLRFDSDDSGMSISMSSKDPGFAPAAQAALAQQSGVNSASQGNTTGQQGGSQHNSSQPGQQWAAANHASLGSGSASGGSAGGQSSGTGGQGWNQGNQNAAPATQGFAPVSLASTTSTGGGDSGPQRRSGILA